MMIRIYQIRDAEKRQAEMEKLLNRPPLSALKEVDESLYHRVFMGDIDCESPYDVLFRMNIDGHRLFRGERMGLTDVAEMEMDAGKLTLLFDSLGVSVIEFDAEKVQKADNLIRVLVIEPHRVPYESEIENTLEGNRRIEGDVLVGPVFIAGDTGESLCSLSDEQLEHYAERFAKPEEISDEEVAENCFVRFIPF